MCLTPPQFIIMTCSAESSKWRHPDMWEVEEWTCYVYVRLLWPKRTWQSNLFLYTESQRVWTKGVILLGRMPNQDPYLNVCPGIDTCICLVNTIGSYSTSPVTTRDLVDKRSYLSLHKAADTTFNFNKTLNYFCLNVPTLKTNMFHLCYSTY